jgi:hypothetical protein
MNMKKSAVWGLGLFSAAALVAAACSPAPAGDDSGTGGEGASDSGGSSSGGKASGGSKATGGNKATGGKGSGGTAAGGADAVGGSVDMGGTAGATMGGQGGDAGTGGSATVEPACTGCLQIFVPLAAAGDKADAETDYGTNLFDITGETITARVYVETTGNAGGIQVYAKDGGAQSYAGSYGAWTNLGSATSGFVDVVLDTANPSFQNDGFDPTAIRYIGVTIQAGNSWDGAVWAETTIYVDSISFTNGSAADITFDASNEGFRINPYTQPVDGSTVTYLP